MTIEERKAQNKRCFERIKELENETAAKIWMVTNQFGRRNLNNYQRSVLALSMEELFKEKAKEKEHARKTSTGQNSDESFEEISTKKEIGKLAKVSHDTIMRVKIYEAEHPEQRE